MVCIAGTARRAGRLSPGAVLFFFVLGCCGFSWGPSKTTTDDSAIDSPPAPESYPRLTNRYEMALSELQELESEPLCHRVAARLLVNNCQILNGQDEATVLTDSGRLARDFVDFYAASLAICDLERGSFVIPFACSEFRESALVKIPPPSSPQLHISTSQIKSCLQGLAQSDSAWNTWVSYRHKALRFCQAAKADNEKDQSLFLYQRITRIMNRLTFHMEEEIASKTKIFENVVDEAAAELESLVPQIHKMKTGLFNLETMIVDQLARVSKESAKQMKDGLRSAHALQSLLETLVKSAEDNTALVIASQQSSLENISQQFETEVGVLTTALSAAIQSSILLQQEMDKSSLRAMEIEERQQAVEAGLDTLKQTAETLSSHQSAHQDRLEEAQDTVDHVLQALESISSSVSTVQDALSSSVNWRSWWPYVLCPFTSLVVGSYRLTPSTTRNFLLVSLGEIAGIVVSAVQQQDSSLLSSLKPQNAASPQNNNTAYNTNRPTFSKRHYSGHGGSDDA